MGIPDDREVPAVFRGERGGGRLARCRRGRPPRNRTRPLYSAASAPSPLASCLQGAHQVEKKSITAGLPASDAFESVSSGERGAGEGRRGAAQLHRLQLLGQHRCVQAGGVVGAAPGDDHADDDDAREGPTQGGCCGACACPDGTPRRWAATSAAAPHPNRRAIAAISLAVASRSFRSTISLGECMYRLGTLITALGTPARVSDTASASVWVAPLAASSWYGNALGLGGLDRELGQRGVNSRAAADRQARRRASRRRPGSSRFPGSPRRAVTSTTSAAAGAIP